MGSMNKRGSHSGRQPARVGPAVSGEQELRLKQAIEAQARGDLAFAETQYRALLAEKVRAPEVYCRLAVVCAQSNRPEEAHRLWKQALVVDPGSLDAAMGLAGSYERMGRNEQAIDGYRRIVNRWPHSITARYLLANLLKAQGGFDEAEVLYQRIIAERPDYAQAHFTYSGIHRYRDRADPHIGTMFSLLHSGSLPAENAILVAFALAKAFEDLQEYREAFKYYEMGNCLRRGTFHYTIDSDADLIDNIMRTFNCEDVTRLQVDAETSNRPIFIVGMVRSGTSLVEKILASHPAVHGAGELDYLFSLGHSLFLDPAIHRHFRPLGTYPANAFETLGRTYLARLDAVNGRAARVTDKLPFNMMMIGLIRIALPNAKIIHCVRDARDTCLSIYRQNFTTLNYRFAYDLESIGRYHNLYRKLMRHWHEVFPGAIYDVCYESLARNPEPEIRKLLAACDLEWNESCLRFHATPGVVKTASYYQVRQPMNTQSIGLWEKYREFLRPLLDVLDPEIIKAP
jgi:tetratricopeptide (TPR) repeat protein